MSCELNYEKLPEFKNTIWYIPTVGAARTILLYDDTPCSDHPLWNNTMLTSLCIFISYLMPYSSRIAYSWGIILECRGREETALPSSSLSVNTSNEKHINLESI